MVPRLLTACSTVAMFVAIGACARPPSARPPVTQPVPPVAAAPLAPASDGEAVAQTALAWVGVLYRSGGRDPSGFDCSGFVQYVFAERGIRMPRGVDDQSRVGHSVSAGRIAPGDLVFFATTGRGASHVGIAVGPDAFVHAPSSSGRVRVERLSAAYWAQRFVGARRVVDGSGLTPR